DGVRAGLQHAAARVLHDPGSDPAVALGIHALGAGTGLTRATPSRVFRDFLVVAVNGCERLRTTPGNAGAAEPPPRAQPFNTANPVREGIDCLRTQRAAARGGVGSRRVSWTSSARSTRRSASARGSPWSGLTTGWSATRR